MSSFGSVDEYLEALPDRARAVLAEVRTALREALPAAEEVIAYQIPTLRADGVSVLHYAGFKAHWSIFPASDRVMAELGDELAPFLSGRATLRFPLAAPVPTSLVQRLAVVRAGEVASEVAARKAKKRAVAARRRGAHSTDVVEL